jgi:phosphoglycolate phosphatase
MPVAVVCGRVVDRLVLWDIDRTLVTAGAVSADIFAAALLATTGLQLRQLPDTGGRTDRDLVATVLVAHGIAVHDELFELFFAELVLAARGRIEDMRARGRALPGARAALEALAEIPGVVQTVVTGNLVSIAEQKLSVFGLADLVDFEVGGYGSDSVDRADLVRLSRERATHKYGTVVADQRVVVIGDTIHDIAGALANGVVAVGVASERIPAEVLQAAGAHVVLASLADTAAVVAAVTTDVHA